jgi:hypothetical protein
MPFSTLEETQGLYTFVFALTRYFFYLRFSLELPYHLRTHAFSFATTAGLHIPILVSSLPSLDYTRTNGILYDISPAASASGPLVSFLSSDLQANKLRSIESSFAVSERRIFWLR